MRSYGYGALHRASAFSRWLLSQIRFDLASLPATTASELQIAASLTPAPQNSQRPFVQDGADGFNRMASLSRISFR